MNKRGIYTLLNSANGVRFLRTLRNVVQDDNKRNMTKSYPPYAATVIFITSTFDCFPAAFGTMIGSETPAFL